MATAKGAAKNKGVEPGPEGTLLVHKDLYPKEVLFGTAFTFLDRCYVLPWKVGGTAYQITKMIYERRAELAAVHKEAANITTTGAAERSPVPFHPGSIRYFKERGIPGF